MKWRTVLKSMPGSRIWNWKETRKWMKWKRVVIDDLIPGRCTAIQLYLPQWNLFPDDRPLPMKPSNRAILYHRSAKWPSPRENWRREKVRLEWRPIRQESKLLRLRWHCRPVCRRYSYRARPTLSRKRVRWLYEFGWNHWLSVDPCVQNEMEFISDEIVYRSGNFFDYFLTHLMPDAGCGNK